MSKYEVHSAVREWYEDETLSAVPCVQCETDADTLEEAQVQARQIETPGDLVAIILEFDENGNQIGRHYTSD